MNERATKIHLALFALILIFMVVIFIESKENVYDETQQQTTTFMEGWKSSDKESSVYNYLPEHLNAGSGISFFTKNQYFEVLVGDKRIYAYFPPAKKGWITPGNRWHFIDLSEKYAREKITLHFYGKDKTKVRLPIILIGDKKDLFRKVIGKSIIPFFLSLVLISIGFIFCIGWRMNRKKVGVDTRMLYLGLLTVGIGIWSGFQTQFLQLFFGNTYDFSIMLYLLFLLIQFPLIKFAFITYGSFINNSKRIFVNLIHFCFAAIIIATLGSIAEIFDISILGRIAQVYFWVCGSIIFIFSCLYYKKVNVKRKKRIRYHLIGFPVLGILFAIDFIQYDYFGSTDGARFSRWGVCLYLFLISYEILIQFIKRISMGADSEKIKNMAYCDALTCMGNRTSFMKNIHEISREEYENYGIAMFDLNNLKVFNDVHGHSAGDYYLIISSEIIRDIFGQKGETYRIGGDEFCAVLKDFTFDEFMIGANEMQERLSQLKGPYTKEEMSIAYGYEKFDKKLDNDLSNTMERADSSMYSIKEKIKKEMKN